MHHSTMLNVDLFRFGLKGTVGALKNFVAGVGGSNVQLKLVQIFRQVATHLQWTLKFHKNNTMTSFFSYHPILMPNDLGNGRRWDYEP